MCKLELKVVLHSEALEKKKTLQKSVWENFSDVKNKVFTGFYAILVKKLSTHLLLPQELKEYVAARCC